MTGLPGQDVLIPRPRRPRTIVAASDYHQAGMAGKGCAVQTSDLASSIAAATTQQRRLRGKPERISFLSIGKEIN